ncbi:unnamed protein product [Mytilus edulis]|uniref:Pleiotrophin/Midkine C-terminal domain-containing protein n=1 Tax=Mytilus edulis TaxID=6550 RepID=A0A8S3RQZ3_MYTED|nr:unnamed protein product [Mytilus edulis]
MSKEVGQDFAIQTFDQQLYAVSQQVKWSMPEVFQSHILRLGGFHTLSCFIACIGKLWADGGLRDLMVDSGVYAGCTVDQMLLGKQFNRSVRGLTLVYEALRSLWFASFFKWCEENDGIDAIPKDVWVMLSKCQAKFSDESESYKDVLNELTILYTTHVLPLTFDKHECKWYPITVNFAINLLVINHWTTLSRVLTLKSGEEGCQQTQNQTITCDRFERLQAWKVKKTEKRREWQELKQQRKEQKQEMKENKQLIKKQLKRCRYEHSDWSECNQATNTVTRNFTLSEGEQGCKQSHTITITCDKLNRIQTWKAKKVDQCKYNKGNWSECDNTTSTVDRVMTLRDGEEEECEPTIIVTISCTKFERIQQWKARKMERKNEKKENKLFIREQKNIWKENKMIVKEQRRLGCSFDVTFSECDPTTNMVTKSYIPTTDDDDSCENRSFEYSCDLHERLMEKKRKRQDKRADRKINRK